MPACVVITRPLAQAEPLAARVRALGRVVQVLPLLDIAPLCEQGELKTALGALSDYALVAFVSPDAVDAAFAHIPAWPRAVTLAVLGEGSRVALARHGVSDANARIVSPPEASASDSENLLAALDLAALRGKAALIVRGDGGRELLAEALRAAGVLVRSVTAYTRAVPALTPALAATLRTTLAQDNDWVVTSSEALRGLLGLLAQIDAADPPGEADASLVAKMQRQQLIVPHARIAQTAQALGLTRLTLTGSGDERLLAALQLRP